jgi:hypothetical protein
MHYESWSRNPDGIFRAGVPEWPGMESDKAQCASSQFAPTPASSSSGMESCATPATAGDDFEEERCCRENDSGIESNPLRVASRP